MPCGASLPAQRQAAKTSQLVPWVGPRTRPGALWGARRRSRAASGCHYGREMLGETQRAGAALPGPLSAALALMLCRAAAEKWS